MGKDFCLDPCVYHVRFFLGGPTLPFFPKGSFYESPLANRKINACSTTWHSVHGNAEIPPRFVVFKRSPESDLHAESKLSEVLATQVANDQIAIAFGSRSLFVRCLMCRISGSHRAFVCHGDNCRFSIQHVSTGLFWSVSRMPFMRTEKGIQQ